MFYGLLPSTPSKQSPTPEDQKSQLARANLAEAALQNNFEEKQLAPFGDRDVT